MRSLLVGDFNNWDPEARTLKQDKKGVWKAYLTLELGTYEYRFLVDGQWQNDTDAAVISNPYGSQNSLRVVGS